ncbi:hypothetical protein LIER_14091 [Lithospermum erythrorhizon]|uniref:Retroviral polymerase SH3-like domain-containing protein n=1 Tax=Lithospermum erythrorhizon TaxID=34254 RepID=A0AAV3Q050_LITER
MTSNESIFKDIDKSVKFLVCLRNGELVEVAGKVMIAIQTQKAKRTKLEEKIEKGIFLCNNSQFKGYHLYNLKTNKLMISRDVEFDENSP